MRLLLLCSVAVLGLLLIPADASAGGRRCRGQAGGCGQPAAPAQFQATAGLIPAAPASGYPVCADGACRLDPTTAQAVPTAAYSPGGCAAGGCAGGQCQPAAGRGFRRR